MTGRSRPTPVFPDFGAALEAVKLRARRTPLLPAPALGEALGREVWIKAECLQRTGSFKIRGASTRIEALTPEERERGVVACSSGNHGKAVATAAADAGVPAIVFVPEWVDPVKLAGIRAAGADARLHGATFDEAEEEAIRLARETGRVYISAYDDPWVIRGQGTMAREIVEDLGGRTPAIVLAALSGGGLIGGIASYFREREEREPGAGVPLIAAVSARNASVMRASLDAGHPVEVPEEETLANALAGGIGLDNRYSFRLIRDVVDVHVSVSEEQIATAMRYAVERLCLVVEGGGAVPLAALLALVDDLAEGDAVELRQLGASIASSPEGPLVVVLSGGNVAPDALAAVLAGSGEA